MNVGLFAVHESGYGTTTDVDSRVRLQLILTGGLCFKPPVHRVQATL